jgi:hypothetical protein
MSANIPNPCKIIEISGRLQKRDEDLADEFIGNILNDTDEHLTTFAARAYLDLKSKGSESAGIIIDTVLQSKIEMLRRKIEEKIERYQS